MEPASLRRIDKYDVLHLIGRGGMGVVYKAADPSLDRVVAIKMVIGGDGDNGLLDRFHREAQFTASLHHPNIVTVYDKGEFEGKPYLVMEYLAGQSLDFMLARQPMTLQQRIGYIRQACNGLQYAHSRQPSIIHRDIKPANLVVLEDGTVKIVDFGIAYIGQSTNTRSGQLMGSYHYMSPEQITKKELDGRSDIFSAGVVLYQLLTLTHPFEGGGIASTLQRIGNSQTSPLSDFLKDYPPRLDAILARALAKDRHERYQFASEFAFELQEVEDELNRSLFGAHIAGAESLFREGEFESARQRLVKVLDLDRQHERANELMRDVQQAIARQQRKIRAGELRARAEDALSQNRRTEALTCLEQAIKLDETNTDLRSFRDGVFEAQARAETLDGIFAQAQRAFATDDLEGASRSLDAVIALEPNSERAQAFRTIIAARFAERQKDRDTQDLLTSARGLIRQQKFSEALGLLGEFQKLHPDVSGLRTLIDLAEAGIRLSAEAAQQKLRREEELKVLPPPEKGTLSEPPPLTEPVHQTTSQKNPRWIGETAEHRSPRFEEVPRETDKSRIPRIAEVALPESVADANRVENLTARATPPVPAQFEPAVTQTPSLHALSHDVLRTAEKYLAPFTGPLTGVLIKRAAAKTNDTAEFYRLLSAGLEERVDRETFLAKVGAITVGVSLPPQTQALPPKSPDIKTGQESRLELTAAELERLAKLLARYVGPLAGVLVKRAAQRADSTNTLHKLLVEHVETEPERTHFLREARFPHFF